MQTSNWGISQRYKNLNILEEVKVSLKPSVYRGGGWGLAGRGQNKDFVSQGFSFWKPPAANMGQGPISQKMELKLCMPSPTGLYEQCSL